MPYDINNAAAFSYLNELKSIDTNFKVRSGYDQKAYNDLLRHMNRIKRKVGANYDPTVDYQALYTKLHELSDKIDVKGDPSILNGAPNLKTFHEEFFSKLYANDSKPFNDIHLNIIAREAETTAGEGASQQVQIGQRLREQGVKKPGLFQFTHPENPANKFFSGLLGIDYNPLKRTNVPYVAFEGHDGSPQVLRMGTQVQGLQTLQKSFLNFLAVKKSKEPEREHHHIYFNLLKRDVQGQGGAFERIWERLRTNTLEKINGKNLGAAVITLPADSASFFEGYSKKEGKARDSNARFSITDLESQLITSIRTNTNDFYIPPDIKQKVFGDNDAAIIRELLNRSAQFVVGNPVPATVTAEQRQAIMFDFVKSQLSNHIIQQINPSTVNFSCKDAIDRGGIHTLWYEFKQRLDRGTPMGQDEFNKHLDSSALLVKGRAVNDHRNVIWNALNEAYMSNPSRFQQAELAWVKPWLTANFPSTKAIEALKSKQNRTPEENTKLSAHVKDLNAYINRVEAASMRANASQSAVVAPGLVLPQDMPRVPAPPVRTLPQDMPPAPVLPEAAPQAQVLTPSFSTQQRSSDSPRRRSDSTASIVSLAEHREDSKKGNRPT